jgi:Flp pilus assembly protein TadB
MILVAIPFVFVGLMFFANRDFIRPLWESSQGHTLAMVAAALVAIGYGMARKVSRVDG